MHVLLLWLYFLLLLVTDIIGLVLAAFTLPGLWLMLAGAAIYAWLTKDEHFIGWPTLITLLVLTAGAEIAELFLGGAGAKKAGASRWGMLGGLVGGILGGIFLTGLIPIPILGTVIGICLGSFIGAFAIEMVLGQPLSQSALIGYGAAKGRFSGILSKVAIGLVMFIITLCMAPPFHIFKAKSVVPAPAPAVANPSTVPATRAGWTPPTGPKTGSGTVFIDSPTPVLRYATARALPATQKGSPQRLAEDRRGRNAEEELCFSPRFFLCGPLRASAVNLRISPCSPYLGGESFSLRQSRAEEHLETGVGVINSSAVERGA